MEEDHPTLVSPADQAVMTAPARAGADLRWSRVVLKLSGEALSGGASGDVVDPDVLSRIAGEIAEARRSVDVEVAIVVGGGNIWRGANRQASGLDRSTSDHMGMLATVINALALQSAIEAAGQPVRVLSAIAMAEVAEPYIRRRAIRHLEKGRVVIFAAGMGRPFFTTDTPAALRAAEIGADAVLKGTHSGVDGVYDADPKLVPGAVRYDRVSFDEVIARDLRVMDLTAITFCKDNNMPVLVFDISRPGNVTRALRGEQLGTLVS